jgi:predicted metalloprotease with PDZ domain
MGRTLPTITDQFIQEQRSFDRFRRALRRSDQHALDSLFASARLHLAAASCASDALPMETFIISMLLEEHKEMLRLKYSLEEMRLLIEKMQRHDDERD